MSKRLPHVEAAKAEALRLGANLIITDVCHHIKGELKYGDQTRKIFMSKTPSCPKVIMNVKEDVRKKVKDMQNEHLSDRSFSVCIRSC